MNSSAPNPQVLIIWILISLSAWAETPAHSSHQTPQNRPQQPLLAPSKGSYSEGRFFKDQFQYQNAQGNWLSALAAFKADESGTLLNSEGKTVEYKAGDILFKTVKGDWKVSQLRTASSTHSRIEVELSEVERLVIEFTNQERIKHGLPPLEVSQNLQGLARQKSANMARLRNLDHGVAPTPRGGENIAWNQRTAQEVVRSWMNSDGHRANILSKRYSKIGVGVANGNGPYWTQMFQ